MQRSHTKTMKKEMKSFHQSSDFVKIIALLQMVCDAEIVKPTFKKKKDLLCVCWFILRFQCASFCWILGDV